MARKLGETLVARGAITEKQLIEALRTQRIFGETLGSTLLRLGAVKEDELGQALALMHDVPAATRFDIEQTAPEVVALVSAEFAKRHRALPFRVDGDRLCLALQNPADSLAIHEAAFLTNFDIVVHVAPEAILKEALERFHPAEGATHSIPSRLVTDEQTADSSYSPEVAPSPPRPSVEALPATLQLAGQQLADAISRDAAFEAALDAMDYWSERSAVFAIRGEEAILLNARRFPTLPPSDTGVDLASSQIFSCLAHESCPPFYGTISPSPADEFLYTNLGGPFPRTVTVVPICLRSRPVAALYGDSTKLERPAPKPDHLIRLASIVAMSLESVILRLKILKTSGNRPGSR